MVKIVAMCGGGIKAAVAAASSAPLGELTLMHVDYGQPSAGNEVAAVRAQAAWLDGAKAITVALPHVRHLCPPPSAADGKGGGSASAPSLPPSALRGLMPLLLSMGAHCALRFGATSLVAGVTQIVEDTPVGLPLSTAEPHRRREFVLAFNAMFEAAVAPRSSLTLTTPLIDVSYADAIRLGQRFQLPFGSTWSCERACAVPCGECEGCTARDRAFAAAHAPDAAAVTEPA